MRFLQGIAREGAKTARAYYDAPGWMANHTQNPWYQTAPSYLPACIGPTCGAWLAQHAYEHFLFTGDREFLRTMYPVLRSSCEFHLATLVEDPKSHALVTAPSNSPENAYRYKDAQGKEHTTALCIGSTYDEQILRGLFAATAASARELERVRGELEGARRTQATAQVAVEAMSRAVEQLAAMAATRAGRRAPELTDVEEALSLSSDGLPEEFAELLWSLREPLLERCRLAAAS